MVAITYVRCGGKTSYRYDKNGQMIEEKTGDSYHITYSYDKAGNRKTVTNSRGQITEYEYDKAGRVIKQKDEAGEISYTYDANGNCLIISETVSESGVQNVSVNTITRSYDALNRVTSQTDADGNHIGYAYDTQGNLSVLTYPDGKELEYSYDKNGNVILVTDWENRETSFSYDKNGRLVRTERADGSTESRSYDKAGQLLQIKDTAKDGRLITDLSYSYNENGNIEQIRDKNAGTAGMESKTETMTYDAVNRLISYNGKAVNYDAENNRIGIIKNAGTEQESRTGYVVDSTSGELTQILQSRTEEAAKSADVGITTYLYAGNRLLAEDGAEYLTYHFNNVGSTTAVTDKSGNIKYRYAYSVYGELLKGNYGEVLFLYNGQYGVQSDDSGLYYMRARYYNAAIKRFINQDIVTGSIESSQSLNRYAYVEGNPISYLDPFGLEKALSIGQQFVIDILSWLIQNATKGGLHMVLYEVSSEVDVLPEIIMGVSITVGILLLVMLIRDLKLNKEKSFEHTKTVIASCAILFVLLIAFIVGSIEHWDYVRIVKGYQNKQYSIVEGNVEDFHTSSRYESFCVDGVKFEYSNHQFGHAYRLTKGEGGVIAGNGQKLRIYYIYSGRFSQNEIVKIEQIEG